MLKLLTTAVLTRSMADEVQVQWKVWDESKACAPSCSQSATYCPEGLTPRTSGCCEACKSGSETCGSGDECCSLHCSSGSCQPCKHKGEPCTSSSDCCGRDDPLQTAWCSLGNAPSGMCYHAPRNCLNGGNDGCRICADGYGNRWDSISSKHTECQPCSSGYSCGHPAASLGGEKCPSGHVCKSPQRDVPVSNKMMCCVSEQSTTVETDPPSASCRSDQGTMLHTDPPSESSGRCPSGEQWHEFEKRCTECTDCADALISSYTVRVQHSYAALSAVLLLYMQFSFASAELSS